MEALISAYGDDDEGDQLHGANAETGDGVTTVGDEAFKRRRLNDFAHENLHFAPYELHELGHSHDRGEEHHLAALEIERGKDRLLARSSVPGRYVSKRERAAIAALQLSSDVAAPSPVHPSPVSEGVLRSIAPPDIQSRLDWTGEGNSGRNGVPKGLRASLKGHTKPVNAVRWSPTNGCLLASAGMDHISCIWNVWDNKLEPARIFDLHRAAVKDVQWSSQGDCLLTCGYDKTSRLIDVETGAERQKFETDEFINVLRFHPCDSELFLSGDAKGVVKLWDIRDGRLVREYFKDSGQILDLDFSRDGKQFACTSDIAKRNSSDKTIIVWDFHSQIALSNQVYLEAYTCPCVRYHPHEQSFIAQSNAGYIAIFSARPPFKMNKYKRLEGHQVSGFPVKCNFSPDGEVIVTGSAHGSLFFYSYRSSKMLKQLRGHRNVSTDAAYHPVLQSVVASCSWDGEVLIFE